MLKILQARLLQYMNRELPDVQAGFIKGRGTREQISNISWIIEKAREFQKNIYFFLLTMPKPLTVWITTNCGELFETEIPDHLTCLLRNLYVGQKQQLELDMEQQIGSKPGKEYVKTVYCHPAYLTYMQNISCEMLGWMKHSWNQDCWEKYQ